MSHKWKWCVIDCTGHAIKGMNRRAVVHRAEADKALAEAEARLAAAEHKCAVCAFKGDGDRLVSLEARLAANEDRRIDLVLQADTLRERLAAAETKLMHAEAEACIKTLQTQNDNCMIDKGRTLTEIASYCAEECHAPACGGCPLRRVGGGRS